MHIPSSVPLLVLLVATACSGTHRMTSEAAGPIAVGSATLILEIDGLRNSDGTVNVSLFAGPEGFPQDTTAVLRSASIVVAESEQRVIRFAGLDYGDYAVSILHDENNNGAMDTGFLGVPSEGFGFSNNPGIGFGAPSFESCKFRLDGPELTLQLQLRYF